MNGNSKATAHFKSKLSHARVPMAYDSQSEFGVVALRPHAVTLCTIGSNRPTRRLLIINDMQILLLLPLLALRSRWQIVECRAPVVLLRDC